MKLSTLVAVCALAATTHLPQAHADTPPNIVFIFADDWGWGDLSCHGNNWIKTPNLDQFAAEGTDFHQFTVNNPVCSPSRTAVLTGQFPARHHVHQHFATVQHHVRAGMPDWLDPQAPMLPRMLKDAGYATAHFGKWHLTNRKILDSPPPSDYGYDEYGAFNLPGPQIQVGSACDHAIDFIRRHRDQPFFINLWIHETHTPHYPKQEWLDKFSHLDKQQQTYAAVVADADAKIGALLATLKEVGVDERTLIVFSSDNGPEITGKPQRKHADDDSTGPGLGSWYSVGTTGKQKGRKRSLFGGGVRVPFIVRWAGKVPAGKVDHQTVVTAVDLLPTFCAAAGAKLPEGYEPDGQDMLSALCGEAKERSKPIYWEWRGTHHGVNWPGLGVRHGQWKLLMSADKTRVELYRHPEDWGEANDLAKEHPEIVQKLSNMALAWKATLPTEIPASCFSNAREESPAMAH